MIRVRIRVRIRPGKDQANTRERIPEGKER